MKKNTLRLLGFFLPFAILSAQPYTLEILLETAKKNPAIQIAAIEAQQAKLTVNEAIGATMPKIDARLAGQFEANPAQIDDLIPGFMGNVNGIISVINGISPIIKIPPFDAPTPNNWAALFSAELTQPVFTWGKIALSITLAKLGLQAKQIQQLTAEREVFTKIAIHAAQVYYLQNMEKITHEQQKTFARLKALAGDNLANKLILPVDAYVPAIGLLETEAARAQIGAQIDSALFSLADFTGLSPTAEQLDFSFIPFDFSVLAWKNADEAVVFVRSSSTEAELLRLQTQISDAQRKIVSSDAWAKPDVGLKLGFNVATNTYNTSINKFRWNFTAGIAINSTLFEGGQSIARVKRAALETQKTILAHEQTLSALEKKLRELNSSLTYKQTYNSLYTQKLQQASRQVTIKKNEMLAGYIEEQVYLEEYLQMLAIQILQQQNNVSFFTDFCLYNFVCGKFPQEYLLTFEKSKKITDF